jgi:hypothetical protein
MPGRDAGGKRIIYIKALAAIRAITNAVISKAAYIVKSPLSPGLPKRGILPPFGKGRLGGISQQCRHT